MLLGFQYFRKVADFSLKIISVIWGSISGVEQGVAIEGDVAGVQPRHQAQDLCT